MLYHFVEAMLLREDLADLMPMVNEANAISQELDKKVTFCRLHFRNRQTYRLDFQPLCRKGARDPPRTSRGGAKTGREKAA